MITSNFTKKTVDGERCINLSKEIQSGEYYGVNFIKKHKLTINQFRIIEECLTELMDIYIEIDLDNVITVKKLKIPAELKHDIKLYDFIRNYYKSMGYVVGQYIKIC